MPADPIAGLSRRLKLLTVGNPKVLKSTAKGYATAILHLAPAWVSGYNTCAAHSAECAKFCLNSAGRGGMARAQGARLRRTLMFFEERQAFLKQLAADIEQFAVNAAALNYEAVYRLNGTSDIRWELHGVPQAFPARRFYDYTRLFNRKDLPPNYHLTYSWSGTNKDACLQALQGGINVAVPFVERPAKFMGYAVVDGDEDDTRFLDAKGVVIGLKPKGKLRGQAGLVWLGDSHPELCA